MSTLSRRVEIAGLFAAYERATIDSSKQESIEDADTSALEYTPALVALIRARGEATRALESALGGAGIPCDRYSTKTQKYLRRVRSLFYGPPTLSHVREMYQKDAERLRRDLTTSYVKYWVARDKKVAEQKAFDAHPTNVYRTLVEREHTAARRLYDDAMSVEWDAKYARLVKAQYEREQYLIAHPDLASQAGAPEVV
jgi:hypothetical protein